MKPPRPATLRVALFVILVIALVSAPFALFGEEFVFPLLQSREGQAGALTAIAVGLLAVDSIAPVPSTIVIMTLAWKAGWLAGIAGGTVGMSLGVLTAGWIGRAAVGRLAPKFIPDTELARLRESLQRRLLLTLACLRSVPVLAETSVIVAAASGIPPGRIFRVTLLPNFIIATIYSLVAAYAKRAEDSLATAAITFVAIVVVSYAVWRVWGAERPIDAGTDRGP